MTSTEIDIDELVPGPELWNNSVVEVGGEKYTVIEAERTMIKVPQRDRSRVEKELEFVYTLHLRGGTEDGPTQGMAYGCAFAGCTFASASRTEVRQHVDTCPHRPMQLPAPAPRNTSARSVDIPKADISKLPITEIIELAQQAAGYRDRLIAVSTDLADANRKLARIRKLTSE